MNLDYFYFQPKTIRTRFRDFMWATAFKSVSISIDTTLNAYKSRSKNFSA